MILNGRLHINITYSTNMFFKMTTQNLINAYIDRSNEAIDVCTSATNRKFTPSDFSTSHISQDDLHICNGVFSTTKLSTGQRKG